MKLSTKGRYAVMAMVDLAQHSAGQPLTLADIATRQDISLSYLEQLFAKLGAPGLLRACVDPVVDTNYRFQPTISGSPR